MANVGHPQPSQQPVDLIRQRWGGRPTPPARLIVVDHMMNPPGSCGWLWQPLADDDVDSWLSEHVAAESATAAAVELLECAANATRRAAARPPADLSAFTPTLQPLGLRRARRRAVSSAHGARIMSWDVRGQGGGERVTTCGTAAASGIRAQRIRVSQSAITRPISLPESSWT